MHTKAIAEPPTSYPAVCSLVFTPEANTNTARRSAFPPADDGATLMRIPDAIYKSAETGKEVSIQY